MGSGCFVHVNAAIGRDAGSVTLRSLGARCLSGIEFVCATESEVSCRSG